MYGAKAVYLDVWEWNHRAVNVMLRQDSESGKSWSRKRMPEAAFFRMSYDFNE